MNFKITHGQINTNTHTHNCTEKQRSETRTHSRAEHGNKYFQNRNEKKKNLKKYN